MRYLISAALFFCPSASYANKVIAETTKSSNNTIFISTGNARVGISTTIPGYPLDVQGDVNSNTLYRAGGTAGATASCPSGQYLDGQTTKGGITTGGSCIAIAATFGSSTTVAGTDTAGIGLGFSNSTGTPLNQVDYVYAKSIDGITQSSGCVVVINVGNGNLSTNFLTFTSTTTLAQTPATGVLLDNTCTVGSICKIAIRGLMRIQSSASQTVGQSIFTSATRCQGRSQTVSSQGAGVFMSTDASTWATVLLGVTP